jgi:hypothetical protein
MVPYTESIGLARAAPEGASSVYLLGGLDHVDLGDLGPADIAALLRAAYRVLAERDQAAAVAPYPGPRDRRPGPAPRQPAPR